MGRRIARRFRRRWGGARPWPQARMGAEDGARARSLLSRLALTLHPWFSRRGAPSTSLPRQWVAVYLAMSLVWVGLPSAPKVAAQSVPEEERSRQFGFAGSLYESDQWTLAAIEFQRFTSNFPLDPRAPYAFYAAAQSYMAMKRFDSAIPLFRQAIRGGVDPYLEGAARFQMGLADLGLGDEEAALEDFRSTAAEYPGTEWSSRARLEEGWLLMRRGEWEAAEGVFQGMDPDGPFASSAVALVDATKRGPELPLRSPQGAGLLSAYIPGMGQLYLGRWRDALVAFLINEGFVVASIVAFVSGHFVLGAILLLVEAGWYAGNVYGSISGAHKYNLLARQTLVSSLRAALGPHPPRDLIVPARP